MDGHHVAGVRDAGHPHRGERVRPLPVHWRVSSLKGEREKVGSITALCTALHCTAGEHHPAGPGPDQALRGQGRLRRGSPAGALHWTWGLVLHFPENAPPSAPQALFASKIVSCAQGFMLLRQVQGQDTLLPLPGATPTPWWRCRATAPSPAPGRTLPTRPAGTPPPPAASPPPPPAPPSPSPAPPAPPPLLLLLLLLLRLILLLILVLVLLPVLTMTLRRSPETALPGPWQCPGHRRRCAGGPLHRPLHLRRRPRQDRTFKTILFVFI